MSSFDIYLDEITARAVAWPVQAVNRETEPGHDRGTGVPQLHLVCADCGQSAYCLSVDTRLGSYAVTMTDLTAGIAAHLRRSHDTDPHGNISISRRS